MRIDARYPDRPVAHRISVVVRTHNRRRKSCAPSRACLRCRSMGGKEELVALGVVASGHASVYMDSLVVHHHPSRARDSQLETLAAGTQCSVDFLPASARAKRLPRDRAGLCTSGREGTFARDTFMMMVTLPWAWARRRMVPPSVLAMRGQVHAAKQRQKEVDRRAANYNCSPGRPL
jgi:hypothetical protein